MKGLRKSWVLAALVAVIVSTHGVAEGAQCGGKADGFEAWRISFAAEAKAHGIKENGLTALTEAKYSVGTIKADRGQKSFKLSLSAFLAQRGAAAIVAKGKALKRRNAALFASIEKHFDIPPGPIVAIWGMETGFGQFTGNQNTLSAVATLAYDCRRPAYFTDQLYAMLKLIDHGVLSGSTRGAMHGEVGQTQFLPKNILLYGADGDGDGAVNLNSKADALASTANFLKSHGWVKGEGYQPGQPNFAAIQGWNAAIVYQRAIALVGKQIDEG